MKINLTQEQKDIIDALLEFKKPIQTLGGYAGTGKSTVLKSLSDKLPNYAVCAFTGKAADVLRRKGMKNASTIHSLIYKPIEDFNGNIHFILADELECDGILADEASTIGKELHNDMASFGLPIIFVGDHGQLEPVGENINLMDSPDFKLEMVHRNAGEIAHFAEFIRKGYKPTAYPMQHKCEKIRFLNNVQEVYKSMYEVDQIICAYNKTRVAINQKVRASKFPDTDFEKPEVGDKITCLRNNKQNGLFNGMQGIIKKLYGKNKMVFQSNAINYDVFYDPKQFGKEKYDFSTNREDPDPFDYVYGGTAHKVQGDEYDHVLAFEQVCKNWDHCRWAYTVASRAKERLDWVDQKLGYKVIPYSG